MTDDERLLYILRGLSSEYNPVVIHLTSRHESVTLQGAQYMLQSQKVRIEQQNLAMDVEPHSTNVSYKKGNHNNKENFNGAHHGGNQQSNRGNYNNRGGRGRGRGGRGQYRPVCQICGKIGHLASTCYFRFDHNFTSSNSINNS